MANETDCDGVDMNFSNITNSTCMDFMTTVSFVTTINTTEMLTNTSDDSTSGECPESTATFVEEEISEWLWKVLPPIIFFFGVTGNFLTICVVRRLGLKNQPTLLFIFVLAITDTLTLIVGLSRYWVLYMFDFDTRTVSTVHCKLYYFFIYFTMHYSSWILVGLTTERVMKIYFPFKYRRVYTTTKVKIGLTVTLMVVVLLNGQFFFTNGLVEEDEDRSCTSLTPEIFYYDEHVYVWVDFTILSIVPFVIMFFSNIFLIRMLRRVQRDRSSIMDQTQLKKTSRVSVRMTKVVVACTVYFLFATAPISTYFIVDTYYLSDFEEACDTLSVARMDLFWTITYLIQFSNYGINFYLYTATNNKFGEELRSLLKCQPSLRQMRVYSLQNRMSGRTGGAMAASRSIGLDERSVSDENNT